MPNDMILEIAQAEYLTPVNPNWQDEKKMNKEEKKELREYLKRLRQQKTT